MGLGLQRDARGVALFAAPVVVDTVFRAITDVRTRVVRWQNVELQKEKRNFFTIRVARISRVLRYRGKGYTVNPDAND